MNEPERTNGTVKLSDKKEGLKPAEIKKLNPALTKEEWIKERDALKAKHLEEAKRESLMVNLAGSRMGCLYFHIEAVHRQAEDFSYILARIGFLPVNVTARKEIEQYEMYGLSPRFERIRKGTIPPVYQITIKDEGKTIEVFQQKPKTKGLEDKAPVKDEVNIDLIKPN